MWCNVKDNVFRIGRQYFKYVGLRRQRLLLIQYKLAILSGAVILYVVRRPLLVLLNELYYIYIYTYMIFPIKHFYILNYFWISYPYCTLDDRLRSTGNIVKRWFNLICWSTTVVYNFYTQPRKCKLKFRICMRVSIIYDPNTSRRTDFDDEWINENKNHQS